MVCKARAGKVELQDSHRCHNEQPDTGELPASRITFIYANEADVLNVALFGMTAKEWRDANPDAKGNIRDYATINQLICLSNITTVPFKLINTE